MRIVVINGSPRQEGNTAQLLRVVAQGAVENCPETEVEWVHLNDLAFRGCQGCRECKHEEAKGCSLQDELTPVLDKLLAAEGWVLGSPIYMGQVTGQLKLFLDRLYGFTGPNWVSRLPQGKRAAVVLTQGMTDESAYLPVASLLERMLSRRGFAAVEVVVAGGTSGAAAGDIAFQDAVEAKAREVGGKLAG